MNRIVLLGALLAASSGFAHAVRVDFSHATHFSCYKTYRWVAFPESPTQPLFPNQLMDQRITHFVEEALASRGLRRVTTGGDLLVSYNMIVTAQPQFVTFNDWGGPGWGWGWGGPGWGGGWGGISTTTVQTFYQGTLVIDMVDARRNELIFQGTSTQSVSSRPAKNTERLAKAVNRIMAKYPPQL